jgi:hypothetical protein
MNYDNRLHIFWVLHHIVGPARLWGSPQTQWVPEGGGGHFPQKRQVHEATTHLHLMPRLGMVKLSLSPQIFMVWCLIKHRDNSIYIYITSTFYITQYH